MDIDVKTKQGVVRGRLDEGVATFKGIPYAAPPFGANRLQPPRPAQRWDGVREAFSYGPTVPKPPYFPPFDILLPEPAIPGEDCLNLNIWTPDIGRTGLPVMVWIHGGAFSNGSSAIPQYDGSHFARDGVVCVTINYRLGADGFLYLDDGISNLGLLDQIAALAWVQEGGRALYVFQYRSRTDAHRSRSFYFELDKTTAHRSDYRSLDSYCMFHTLCDLAGR